ncbi:hypothetical protein [Hahella ganghwensis]|uniref:hypothetical protein n=1 Tax=Hahella ganghwensis TaxID=286420 RepID=UPI000373D36F|nr:hypothetical protein [Hahella ganghwensis]
MIKLISVLAVVLVLTGCVSSKSYVDPAFGRATYEDIKPVEEKYNTKINVEFQRNGVLLPAAYQEVRGHVERILRASGVVVPSKEDSDVTLSVTVNNIGDVGQAAMKGFGTGLTLGAAGSTVTDHYEVSIVYSDGNGEDMTKKYQHALHTTIGNSDAPFENVQPTTMADGFGRIVEQVLLNFIQEMQTEGKLTMMSSGKDSEYNI